MHQNYFNGNNKRERTVDPKSSTDRKIVTKKLASLFIV